jgi:hypothetical protein
MTPSGPAHEDPLIDEVRQRRRELLAAHGDDLQRLGEAIRRREAEHPEKMVDRRRRKAREASQRP